MARGFLFACLFLASCRILHAAAPQCGRCHAKELRSWLSSQHAAAARLVDDRDRAALAGAPFGKRADVTPVAVIGVEPLRQYLVKFPGGRFQVLDWAYDPAKRAWFEVFPGENRQAHEWGHWTNRGMNWNSQCAACHMTGLKKQYDSVEDSYKTTWKAFGIACVQCHGEMPQHSAGRRVPPEERLAVGRAADVCASCHTRQESLTGNFRAGERHLDHFRPMLMDAPGVFHPDGQVRSEDFEGSSFQQSRMAQMGVTCLDCHDPHSGKLVKSAEDNELCLKCHTSPGARGAKPVDAAHAHHKIGSSGALCVNCHMPESVYMVRDKRRDHGFTKPDPLLTKELGIPNACNSCHRDKSVDWAVEWSEKYYPGRGREKTRGRARTVAKAQAGDEAGVAGLVTLVEGEGNAAWRAGMVALLGTGRDRPEVVKILEKCVTDPSPLVRSAVARAAAKSQHLLEVIRPLLSDTVRLVRLDAMLARLDAADPVAPELEQYLAEGDDQPAGAMRRAHVAVASRAWPEAERWLRRAVAWDPTSAVPRLELAQLLNSTGRTAAAEKEFLEAARLEPANPEPLFALGLLRAASGNMSGAREALERCVAASPLFGRALYNLGLVYAKLNRPADAIKALRKAASLLPDSVEPLMAEASILQQQGDAEGARRAVERARGVARRR